MDIGELMKTQMDTQNYTRWKSAYDTYVDLSAFINVKLSNPGYNKLDIGADIMNYMVEQLKKYEQLIDSTEMGKTMNELEKKMKIEDQLKTIDKITDKAIKYVEKDRVGKRRNYFTELVLYCEFVLKSVKKYLN